MSAPEREDLRTTAENLKSALATKAAFSLGELEHHDQLGPHSDVADLLKHQVVLAAVTRQSKRTAEIEMTLMDFYTQLESVRSHIGELQKSQVESEQSLRDQLAGVTDAATKQAHGQAEALGLAASVTNQQARAQQQQAEVQARLEAKLTGLEQVVACQAEETQALFDQVKSTVSAVGMQNLESQTAMQKDLLVDSFETQSRLEMNLAAIEQRVAEHANETHAEIHRLCTQLAQQAEDSQALFDGLVEMAADGSKKLTMAEAEEVQMAPRPDTKSSHGSDVLTGVEWRQVVAEMETKLANVVQAESGAAVDTIAKSLMRDLDTKLANIVKQETEAYMYVCRQEMEAKICILTEGIDSKMSTLENRVREARIKHVESQEPLDSVQRQLESEEQNYFQAQVVAMQKELAELRRTERERQKSFEMLQATVQEQLHAAMEKDVKELRGRVAKCDKVMMANARVQLGELAAVESRQGDALCLMEQRLQNRLIELAKQLGLLHERMRSGDQQLQSQVAELQACHCGKLALMNERFQDIETELQGMAASGVVFKTSARIEDHIPGIINSVVRRLEDLAVEKMRNQIEHRHLEAREWTGGGLALMKRSARKESPRRYS